jgi:Heterokaryon incompatibility protein (HET)
MSDGNPIVVPCPWGIFSSSLVPDPRTARLGSFALASSWIEKCGLSHSCVVPRDSKLPSRVLDIGTTSDRIRLFETNGLVGRYACLSHCWGGKQILRTTKDNVKSHLVSIPWNDIPRTFQDAIIFVWQLGLQYLWIDSLCIIQDDIDDWVRESAAMCDIFENSWLTIAATSASDAQTGLYLRDRNEFFDVCNTTSTGAEYRVLACRSYSHPQHTEQWFENDHWPLLTRGWVFQERLISPRVLHICRTEMIWECKEEMVCECGESQPMGKEDYYQSLKQPSLTKLLKQWQNLVEAYSSLKLSFESDKLPALSGLANQMAKFRPDAKYLAGLWSDSLEMDLLWINSRVGSECGKLDSRSSLWRAPSWSWAALNAPVIFPLSNTHYYRHDPNRGEMVESYFAILDAQTCLATSDPTGQVKSARLTICGSLFDATLWIDKQFSNPEMFLLSIDSVGKKVLQRHNVPDRVLFDDPYDPLHLGSETNCSGEGISCMRMARVRHRHYFPYQEVVEFEYALVVYRKSGSTDYKRVGMVVQERASELAEDLINPSGMWQNWPSCFAAGGLQRTIAIV